jgi:hypothetical protein
MGIFDDIQSESFKGDVVFRNSVTGYRFWHIMYSGRINSKFHTAHHWEPGINNASCMAGQDHEAPEPECHCGFFAMVRRPKRHELWEMRRKDTPNLIFGMVKGYGNVIPGTRGWRAQKAEILALYFDPMQAWLRWNLPTMTSEYMNKAQAYYGVPCFKEYEDFETFAQEHEEPYELPKGSR